LNLLPDAENCLHFKGIRPTRPYRSSWGYGIPVRRAWADWVASPCAAAWQTKLRAKRFARRSVQVQRSGVPGRQPCGRQRPTVAQPASMAFGAAANGTGFTQGERPRANRARRWLNHVPTRLRSAVCMSLQCVCQCARVRTGGLRSVTSNTGRWAGEHSRNRPRSTDVRQTITRPGCPRAVRHLGCVDAVRTPAPADSRRLGQLGS
jgi:hypothetical protein